MPQAACTASTLAPAHSARCTATQPVLGRHAGGGHQLGDVGLVDRPGTR